MKDKELECPRCGSKDFYINEWRTIDEPWQAHKSLFCQSCRLYVGELPDARTT